MLKYELSDNIIAYLTCKPTDTMIYFEIIILKSLQVASFQETLVYAYQTSECVTLGLISKTIRSISGLEFDYAKKVNKPCTFMSDIIEERIKKSRNDIPEPTDIHVCGVNTNLPTSRIFCWITFNVPKVC